MPEPSSHLDGSRGPNTPRNPIAAGDQAADRMDAVVVEYFERLDRGEAVDLATLVAEHPDLADELREFFSAAEMVASLAGPRRSDELPKDLSEELPSEASADTSRIGDTHGQSRDGRTGPQLATGSRLGRYQVRGKLGQGAMGSVYLAYDDQLSRQVALKIPVLDASQEPEMIERFYREARAAAQLRSPHICPVYDVDQQDGIHFIAMAYIEGRPLSSFVRDGRRLPARRLAEILRKLALALEKAHGQGIIHRDLKPSNIMLDAEGEPVIMDFGLARQLDGGQDIKSTRAGVMVGSPAYMSPEQVLGDRDAIGPATDIYSLGVVLYELLTGELPFQGSVLSVVGQIVAGQPRPLAQVNPHADPSLAAICQQMMAKRIADRFGSMHAVAEALQNYLTGRPLPPGAVETDPSQPSQTPGHTHAGAPANEPAAAGRQPGPDRLPPVPFLGAPDVVRATPVPMPRAAKPHPAPVTYRDETWVGGAIILCVVLAIGLLGAALVLGAGYYLLKRSPQPPRVVEVPQAANDLGEPPSVSEPTTRPPDIPPQVVPFPQHEPRPLASGPGYRWTKGLRFGYDVSMRVSRGGRSETLDGSIWYSVVDVRSGQATLAFDCLLAAHRGDRFPGPPGIDRLSGFVPLDDVVGRVRAHQLTLDANGTVARAESREALPFGMGSLAELPFVPWPQQHSDRWQHQRRSYLELQSAGGPPFFGPFRSRGASSDTEIPITVSEEYVRKDGALATAMVTAQQRFAEESYRGEGTCTWHIDSRTHLTQSLELQWTVHEPASLPLEVSLHLRWLTPAELAGKITDPLPSVGSAPELPASAAGGEAGSVAPPHEPPDPTPGRPVTAETPLAVGDQLQAWRGNAWHDATVVSLEAEGQVRVHWVGYGAELDRTLPRSYLRFLSTQSGTQPTRPPEQP